MSWKNYDDVLAQLRAAGLDVDGIDVGTSRPVRVKEFNGDREKRGWYWLNEVWLDTYGPDGAPTKEPYIVGSFGIYRGNDAGKMKVKLSRNGPAMTAQQAAAMKARHAENVKRARAQREAEQERAAQEATRCWAKYLPVSPQPSDYLLRKAVGGHGVRYSPGGNGTVAIPMCDDTGKVWGLQIIRGKNRGNKLEKQYWPAGMNKTGHYHMLGSPSHVILLAEGYATAATLFEATGLCTVVAFDANNLLPVATALHKTYPRAYILACADDDYLTDGNPGVSAAMDAATAVRGGWVKPEFPDDRGGKKLTDFNDLMHFPQGGQQVVRAQIEAALAASGRDVAGATQKPNLRLVAGARSEPSKGGGEERSAEAIMPLDGLIERFIPIDDGTGDYVFDTWTNKIAKRTQMVALLPAGVRVDDIKRHPAWIERGAYFIDEVGFDPAGEDGSVKLNTWRGWPRTPKAGSCELLLDLLAYLCSTEPNQDEVYRWLLCWMAYPLQHPGAKMSSAVIMHGPQGTGKSTVFQALAWIYGAGTTRDYSTVLNQRGLEDKFNADWAADRLYILAEEVVTRAEMWHIKNELKELVTGARIRVNPKHTAAYTQRNHINIVYLSNEGQPLPLDNDDRRHLVVYTPPAQPESFYEQVQRELNEGGYEAFYDHLLNLDLTDFHPAKRPPMTQAKQKLIDLSLPSEAIFVREWQAGQLEIDENEGPLPFCPCGGRHLYTAYKKWCGLTGVNRPRDETQFIGYVGRLPDWQAGKTAATLVDLNSTGYKNRKMVIPSLQAIAEAAAAGARTIDDQGGSKPRTRWLAESFYAFSRALGGAQ
jgi:putative DNA primase/helicase